MKKIILIALILLLIASVSALVVRVYPSEISNGTNLITVVINNNQGSINDARIRITAPDFYAGQNVDGDVREGRSVKTSMEMDVPHGAKGYYPVRVVVSDENGVEKVTHSWVYVG